MTVNGTVSLCLNSVDSSLAKMVASSDSGSFEVAISRHSGTVAGSATGFSLGKRMVVVGFLGLGLDSGNLAPAGSRPLISLAGSSDDVRAWERAKRKKRAATVRRSLAIFQILCEWKKTSGWWIYILEGCCISGRWGSWDFEIVDYLRQHIDYLRRGKE